MTYWCNSVGYPGKTQAGAEAGLIITAPSQPIHTGAAQLVSPASYPDGNSEHKHKGDRKFDLFHSWGNLSPWYTVPQGAFGIDESPEPPDGCDLVGVHVLHRHGARYPAGPCKLSNYGRQFISPIQNDTQFVVIASGPATFARRLHKTAAEWEATGSLAFLNDW